MANVPTEDEISSLWQRIMNRGSKDVTSLLPKTTENPIYDYNDDDQKILEQEARREREMQQLELLRNAGLPPAALREELERQKYEDRKRAELETKRRMLDWMKPSSEAVTNVKSPLGDFLKSNPFSSDKIVDQNKQIENWFREYVKESIIIKKIDEQVHRYNKLYNESINPGYNVALVVNLAAITKQHIMVSFAVNLVGGLKEESLICETRNIAYTTSRSEFREKLTEFLVLILTDMVYPAMFKITSAGDTL
jgi:hypothetical protein